MGYRRKLTRLTWAEGEDLAGLQVTLKSLSIGRLQALSGLAVKATTPGADPDAQLTTFNTLIDAMAACLVSWNLEDHDGTPIPATRDGLADQDIGFIVQVAVTWMEAVASVDIPLPPGSNGTHQTSPSTALEASLPMVASSASQPG